MSKRFEQCLQESMYVHYPLKVDASKSIEAKFSSKSVLNATDLWDGVSLENWRFDGEGEAMVTGGGVLDLTTSSTAEHWPGTEVRALNTQSGEYATFGSYTARLCTKGMDLAHCNRIRFKIRPTCNGLHSPIVRVGFVNNGAIKIPDQYSREGFNAINLENGVWNECFWEMGSIVHDRIDEISFEIHRYGKEVSTGDVLHYEIKDVSLEEIEKPEVVLGWQPGKETAVFSTTGYFAGGRKTAVVNTAETRFDIVNSETGMTVYSGSIEAVTTHHGEFGIIDFTPFTDHGTYQIRFGSTTTEAFAINDTVIEDAVWKILNFLYCERCGCPIPGKHGTCHGDTIARHNGLMLAFQGGWHDAADVSQQTVQTAEILHSILEMAAAVKSKNPMLYSRLLEEANWGLDFVIRMRFNDGYRASNANIRRWTDGLIGNMDDCEVSVHNHSFENFIAAGVEAEAYFAFAGRDDALAWKCLDCAKTDFAFAVERFESVGLEEPLVGEHSACASLSQYYAAAAFSASKLFAITGDALYQTHAEQYAGRMLACQETGKPGLPLSGFFYRDETKRAIVHFSHQGREQIFMQALTSCCEHIPQSAKKPVWETAMSLYGEYLKNLMQYTAPYGMLPAGVFAADEPEDAETFAYIHPRVDYGREKANYREQIANGISISDGYVAKCFPVWFSYRGNSAIHLSMGKAASLLGNYFSDNALLEIACEQLYWTVGKNPPGQSLIYGEGSNYGQQYTALLGETVGEMPVGIQTLGNGDEPYWPQANIATYREVWTTPSARWLWIAADLL